MCASLLLRAPVRGVVVSFLAMMSLVATCGVVSALEPWPSVRPSTSAAEEKIVAALKELTTVAFIETPLEDALSYLERQHDINIKLDRGALEDFGVGTDTPISQNLSGVRLSSALRLMLHEHDLSFLVRDEVLLITTVAVARNQSVVRMYDVARLLRGGETASVIAGLLEQSFGGSPSASAPRGRGGRGAARGGAGARGRPTSTGPRRFYGHHQVLIAHDTQQGHEEVAGFLSALAEALVERDDDFFFGDTASTED